MLFKFVQKPIVLDCFITSEQTVTIAPINHAYKSYPDWWNELQLKPTQNGIEYSNMRSCMGMTDFFKNSIHIPMWCDLFIDVMEDLEYRWMFSDSGKDGVIHPDYQYGNFLSKGKSGHLKLSSPWALKCKEDIRWVWTQPTYNFPQMFDVTVLPGNLSFKDTAATHVNLVINTSRPKSTLIPVGQPLVSLTPMSGRKVIINRHVVSQEEHDRVLVMMRTCSFNNIARKVLRMKEKNKGCPYKHYLDKK